MLLDEDIRFRFGKHVYACMHVQVEACWAFLVRGEQQTDHPASSAK